MKRNAKSYKKLRKYHLWFSIVLGLFILVFAFSGMVLNHRELLSSVDISRNLLPGVYSYHNWNLAAVRGSVRLHGETSLLYGNIGVWITKDDFRTFEDFNRGFPKGIDNRKISKIVLTPDKQIFAGTFFGLYTYDSNQEKWIMLDLPGPESRIVDLMVHENELWILTRSFLLKADFTHSPFRAKACTLPPPENYKNQEGLFKTLWVIHNGEIYGLPGKVFVDIMALILIFLTLTGLMLWIFPGMIKRRKRNEKSVQSFVSSMRFSMKWHNKLGYYLLPFLILTTVTGMFLRPPLLIPIAGVKVGKIPFTELDSPNPWFDKLRALISDPETGRVILNTSEGFYYSDDAFLSELKPFDFQPPVSVMGINIFEPMGDGGYLVASFSGIFAWFPAQQYVEDILSRKPWKPAEVAGPPISANAITGMVTTVNSGTYLFDYGRGAFPFVGSGKFPEMPEDIIRQSPISLWNTALEFHTARIYSAIIGDFYFLIVPVVGLSLLFIVISGFLMYWAGFRGRRKRPD